MPSPNIITPVTWTPEAIPDLFDVLADIDGNVIVDSTDTAVNVYGGYFTESGSVTGTWVLDGTSTVIWTPEG